MSFLQPQTSRAEVSDTKPDGKNGSEEQETQDCQKSHATGENSWNVLSSLVRESREQSFPSQHGAQQEEDAAAEQGDVATGHGSSERNHEQNRHAEVHASQHNQDEHTEGLRDLASPSSRRASHDHGRSAFLHADTERCKSAETEQTNNRKAMRQSESSHPEQNSSNHTINTQNEADLPQEKKYGSRY
jgi:hypothetical protein